MVDQLSVFAKNPLLVVFALIAFLVAGVIGGRYSNSGALDDARARLAVLTEQIDQLRIYKGDAALIAVLVERLESFRKETAGRLDSLQKEIDDLKKMLKLSMNAERIAQPYCRVEVKNGSLLQMPSDN